jgi:hypothetical protein
MAPHSEERKKNISEGGKQRWADPEYRAAQLERLKNALHSPEMKEAARQRSRARAADPEFQEAQRQRSNDHYRSSRGGPSNARGSISYQQWQQEVIERAGGRCERCGSSESLRTHHKIDYDGVWIDNPLNVDVNNGELLCQSCHRKHHLKEQS